MSHTAKTCPGCGQALRIPEELGGVAMACPNCGQRIPSFFKIGAVNGVPVKSPSVSMPPLASGKFVPRSAALLEALPQVDPPASAENAGDDPLARTSLLSASGLARYKLMQRQG